MAAGVLATLPEAKVASSELRLELEAVEALAEDVVVLPWVEEEDLEAGVEDKKHQIFLCCLHFVLKFYHVQLI